MKAFNFRGQFSSDHDNRILKKGLIIFLIALLAVTVYDTANAKSRFTDDFNDFYGTDGSDDGRTMGSCITCHKNRDGSGGENSYGKNWDSYGRDFSAVEARDSDGDGFSNIDEIIADTFPGEDRKSVV